MATKDKTEEEIETIMRDLANSGYLNSADPFTAADDWDILDPFDYYLNAKRLKPIDTTVRPWDSETVEEKSQVPVDVYVDFSNIDILTGGPKK